MVEAPQPGLMLGARDGSPVTPDRRFYANNPAFGRLGIRWFTPQVMPAMHSHGHIEMNWLTKGSMEYLVDGQTVIVPAGRLVIFWAGIPHQSVKIDLGPDEDAEQCNIYMPFDQFLYFANVDRLQETMIEGGLLCLPADLISETALRLWYRDYRSRDPERIDIMRMEIYALLRRASILGWDELLPPRTRQPEREKERSTGQVRHVVTMLQFILENLTEPLTNGDIAGAVGLHPNYALHLFNQVVHMPLRRFIIRMRLMHARVLLFETDLSIANIAFNSGFRSLSQFYAHFRKAYGVTPLELRSA